MTTPATADLCDRHGHEVRVLAPGLLDLGGVASFSGLVTTLRVSEDNARVRAVLSEPGSGRVLVIDGGRSLRCALVGGTLATLAATNGWGGIIVWGAVRDVPELLAARIGIRALATCPRAAAKTGTGERDVRVHVSGVTFAPGQWVAADADGIVVADGPLT